MRGKRGKDNEPRKVGMYLVKELCDLKLKEIAEHFGTASYGTVGWACHGVASRMQADAKVSRPCQQHPILITQYENLTPKPFRVSDSFSIIFLEMLSNIKQN